MSKTILPLGYKSALDMRQTQQAIGFVKTTFSKKLCDALNLCRASAPLFVKSGTGINDDLNGTERAVRFDISETKVTAEVVHSLAKWKRMALAKYGFCANEGLVTDMNAIRRDEETDNLHSLYVDQWDWERVITKSQRNEDFLKEIVQKIVGAICDTQDELQKQFPQLKGSLRREVSFVTTQKLEDLYPSLSPRERENTYLMTHKTAFVMQIGGQLASGIRHDGRAPDYDDWQLNGDILFYNEVLGCAFEVSSMGIRVDKDSLMVQLKQADCTHRTTMDYHAALLADKLPLTIGGGIGQSRLCMLLTQKAHIGEVQCSIWDDSTLDMCAKNGIKLL